MAINKIYWQMVGIGGLDYDSMEKALRDIKAIGYDGVEFAGFKGWKAKDLRKLLDDIGLTCIGNHFKEPDLHELLDQTIEDALILGMPAIGGKQGIENNEFTPENLKLFYDDMRRICNAAEAAGLKYYVHLSTNLLEKVPDGRILFDAMMAEVPNLHAQIDTIWCLLGDGNPAEYISKYAGRELNIHYKDVSADTLALEADRVTRCRYADRHDCVAGEGEMDYVSILNACRQAQIDSVIIEQMGKGSYESSIDVARRAYNNMKKMIASTLG